MVEDRRDCKPLLCLGFIKPCILCRFQVDWRRRKTKALPRFVRSISLQAGSHVKVKTFLTPAIPHSTSFRQCCLLIQLSLLSLSSLESDITGLMVMHVGGNKMALQIDLRYADDDVNGIGRGLGSDHQETAV